MTRHQAPRRSIPDRARHRARTSTLGEHEDGARQRTACSVLLALSGGLATAAIVALGLTGDDSLAGGPDGPGGTGVRPPVDSSDGSRAGSLGQRGSTDSPAFADLTQYGAGEGWRAVPCIGLPGFTWGELDLLLRPADPGARAVEVADPAGGPAWSNARTASVVDGDGAPGTGPRGSAQGAPRAVTDTRTVSGIRPQGEREARAAPRDAEPSPQPVPRVTEPVGEPVQQMTEPVREPVQQVREPVQQVAEPVREPVQQVTEPVREPVQQVTEPVREPVQQVLQQAPAVPAPAPPPVAGGVQDGGPLGLG